VLARSAGGTVLLFIFLLLLGGCDAPPADDAPVERPEAGFIAFVGAGGDNPLWPILRGSAEQHILSLAALEVRFFSPEIESPREQIELLQTLGNPRLRGLCIQQTDAGALRSVLEDIDRRGVPIVTMLQAAPEGIAAGHVGLDDLEIGRLLALAAARALAGAGAIMVLHAGHEHPVYGLRLAGFEKEMATHHGVEVFARVDSGLHPSTARREIEERSQRFPRLSAWVVMGHIPVRDLLPLDELLPPECKLITFGGEPDHWPLIRSGRSPAAVTADYRGAGARAVHFCEMALREGSGFSTRHHLPLRVIEPADLEDHIRDWREWSRGGD
jgi:ABC-type sugar transport system substrate-binding protein